jgi:hypothetical protein
MVKRFLEHVFLGSCRFGLRNVLTMMNELRTRIAFKAEDEDIQPSEILGEQGL